MMKKKKGYLKKERCVQCGSIDIKKTKKNRYKCNHCGCVYQFIVPKIFIKKGANVHFGSNVSMKGGIEVEEGANVTFHGEVEIIEDGVNVK